MATKNYTVTGVAFPYADVGGKRVKPGDTIDLTDAQAENELSRGTVYLTGGTAPVQTPLPSVELPAGGTKGQALIKASAIDGDAVWEDTRGVTLAGGGVTLRSVRITQTAYDALATKDANTFYVISGA